MPRILVADDHPLFRQALAQMLRRAFADAHVFEADTLLSTRALLTSDNTIELVLLDLHLPDSHGLMGLATLRAEFPAVAVAMISAHEDATTIRRALALGAATYVPKRCDPATLADALQRVFEGNDELPPVLSEILRGVGPARNDSELATRFARLSPQQFRVLGLIADGLLNKQIADVLDIQERTVKAHVTAIFERLGVRNRTQAGVLLRSLELTDPAGRVDDAQ
ncbi:MAG: response regulator transcription factor [Rudaea sp.]